MMKEQCHLCKEEICRIRVRVLQVPDCEANTLGEIDSLGFVGIT